MPRAEESLTPKGRPYGERAAEEELVAATQPAEAPLSEPVVDVAIPVEPQTLAPFEEPDFEDVEEDIPEGMGLFPEEMAALQDGLAASTDQGVQELEGWLPILQHIASRAGASQGMRNLAAAVEQQARRSAGLG